MLPPRQRDQVERFVADGHLRFYYDAAWAHGHDLLDVVEESLRNFPVRVLRIYSTQPGGLRVGDLVAQTAGYPPSEDQVTTPSDDEVKAGFNNLVELDPAFEQTLVLIEGAYDLHMPAWYYLQMACRAAPHLRIGFAGPEGLADILDQQGAAGLGERPVTKLTMAASGEDAELCLIEALSQTPASVVENAASAVGPADAQPNSGAAAEYEEFDFDDDPVPAPASDDGRRADVNTEALVASLRAPQPRIGRIVAVAAGVILLGGSGAWLLTGRTPAQQTAATPANTPTPANVSLVDQAHANEAASAAREPASAAASDQTAATFAPAVSPAATPAARATVNGEPAPPTPAAPVVPPSGPVRTAATPEPVPSTPVVTTSATAAAGPSAAGASAPSTPATPVRSTAVASASPSTQTSPSRQLVVAAAPAPALVVTSAPPVVTTPVAVPAPPPARPPFVAAPPPIAAVASGPFVGQTPAAVPATPFRLPVAAAPAAPTVVASASPTLPSPSSAPPAPPARPSVVAAAPPPSPPAASATIAPVIVAAIPPAATPTVVPAPAPSPGAAPVKASPSTALADALLKRADTFLQTGDVSGARTLYERAVEAGSARAAIAMGQTFDPQALAERRVVGIRPDPARAIDWYRRALTMGDQQAVARLQSLHALEVTNTDHLEKQP